MSEIHEKLVGLGYAVYGFGEHGSEVVVHYRRGRDNGMRVYRFGVDDEKRPCRGGGFHRLMSWLQVRMRPRVWWRVVYDFVGAVWLICWWIGVMPSSEVGELTTIFRCPV